MYPILFSIGGFELYALGVCYIVGFALFNYLVLRLSRVRALGIGLWNKSIVALTVVGVVSARATYVLTHGEQYRGSQLNVLLPDGFSYYGGMLGCALILWYLARQRKEDLWEWLDVFAVAFFGWLAIVSIGHFLDGSNYGTPTMLPWGVTYNDIAAAVVYTIPVHPIQLYQTAFALVMLTGLWLLYCRRKTDQPGMVTLIGGFALGLFDFFLQFLAGDDTLMLSALRIDQVFALVLWITCASVLLRRFLERIQQ